MHIQKPAPACRSDSGLAVFAAALIALSSGRILPIEWGLLAAVVRRLSRKSILRGKPSLANIVR